MFLDIKGTFDHINKARLVNILTELGLPPRFIQWVHSFTTTRSVRLAFEGQVGDKTRIDTGIPQGSPISSILFLIYVRSLVQDEAFQLSYIDDFSLSITSASVEKNCTVLNRLIHELFQKAQFQKAYFDPDKTELIHFCNKREPETASIRIGNLEVHSKPLVRWLGIWFDSKLTFKGHVEKRINSATSAFFGLQRLTNTQQELDCRSIRRLYIACITTIADYGVQVWWKAKNQKFLVAKYQKLQNLAIRLMTGAFKGSPYKALEIEASIPPPEVRFERLCNRYAIRTLLFNNSYLIHQLVIETTVDEFNSIPYSFSSNIRLLPPISQLFSLIKRIELLGFRRQLETLYSDQKPWTEVKTEVTISTKSKEEETKAHQDIVRQLAIDPFDSRLILYIDGSQGFETNSASLI